LALSGNNSTQSWNRYAYVGNNPLAYVDPTGMFLSPCSPGGGCDWFGNNCTVDGESSNCGTLGEYSDEGDQDSKLIVISVPGLK
jgi:hypothetical protein